MKPQQLLALIEVGSGIWLVDGPAVPWYGMPYTTRTTIVRLDNGSLWIHSPIQLTSSLLTEVNRLGDVKYLIAPNKIHHLFLSQWIEAYPQAHAFAAPGLIRKRPDIHFAKELIDTSEEYWEEEIDQTIFKGSQVMQEVVFFHRASQTLILTDLIENFPPDHFQGYQKILAKITGILSPNGKTPLDWRLSFYFNKYQARKSLETLLRWQPKKIVLAHGECIFEDAEAFLVQSFNWL